jgi:hypothetical protein
MIEAAAPITVFRCENRFRLCKEYFLQCKFFKVEMGVCLFQIAYSAKVKKHMYLHKKTIYVRRRSI